MNPEDIAQSIRLERFRIGTIDYINSLILHARNIRLDEAIQEHVAPKSDKIVM